MQFLCEEITRKLFKAVNDTGIFFKIPLKIIISIFIIGALYFLGRAIYFRNYVILYIIFGLWIIAEGAHYVRKSREKVMVDRITEENDTKESVKDLLDTKRTKNTPFLSANKPKNDELVVEDSKNKELLEKKKIEAETLGKK
jgi:hypothetical protein